MPRSFLVKRGGLHHLRHVARSPSPGATAVMFSELEKRAGAWDTSLEYTKPKTNGDNAIATVLLQQDLKFCNEIGSRHPFSPQSYGGWQRFLFVLSLLRLNFTLLNSSSVWSNKEYMKNHIFQNLSVCFSFQTAVLLSPVVLSTRMFLAKWKKSFLSLPNQKYCRVFRWGPHIQTNCPDWESWNTIRSWERPGAAAALRSALRGRSAYSVARLQQFFFMKFLFLFHFDFLFLDLFCMIFTEVLFLWILLYFSFLLCTGY